jgi:hypothetical protein
LVPGPADELEVVNKIYQWFIESNLHEGEIEPPRVSWRPVGLSQAEMTA